MTNVATEPIVRVSRLATVKSSKLPAAGHIVDHLQCAGLLAQQNKFDTASYLIRLAIAAVRENISPARKRR